jgi:hypothetical protein
MSDVQQDASSLAATPASLYHHQGATMEARLLKAGRVELSQSDYDNWNGGTYTYAVGVHHQSLVQGCSGSIDGSIDDDHGRNSIA